MSANYLYLDIETIPAQDPQIRAEIADAVTHPASMKKPETIEAWEREQKPAAVDEAIAKTSFNGALGQVCCIGWAFNGDEPFAICGVSETDMLHNLIEAVHGYGQYAAPTVVGPRS
jgi:hypothetical protein